jgi:cell division protein FtsQ
MEENRSHRRSDKIRRRIREESKTSVNRVSTRISDAGHASLSDQLSGKASSDSLLLDQAEKANKFFKIGWRLLSFTLLAICSFALLTAWRTPQYKVSTIQVKGLNRLSEEEVLNALNIYGKHIFALEKESVIEPLSRTFPELKDVRVEFSLPAKVFLNVTERQPMLNWQINETQIWIDSEGYLIPANGESGKMLSIQADAMPAYHIIIDDEVENMENVIRDKPKIKEISTNQAFFYYPKEIDGNLLTAILQLNAWMPDESTLLYQEKRGVGWNDIRGWEVFIGSKLENINDKMVMYETIVRKLEEQGIQPSMVSVEFLHAPYYRLDE